MSVRKGFDDDRWSDLPDRSLGRREQHPEILVVQALRGKQGTRGDAIDVALGFSYEPSLDSGELTGFPHIISEEATEGSTELRAA